MGGSLAGRTSPESVAAGDDRKGANRFAANQAPPGEALDERYSGEDTGEPAEHVPADVFIEHEPADEDTNRRDEVGDDRGAHRAGFLDEPHVRDDSQAGTEGAEASTLEDDVGIPVAGVGAGGGGNGIRKSAAKPIWPLARTTGGTWPRCFRMKTRTRHRKGSHQDEEDAEGGASVKVVISSPMRR